MFVGPLDNLLAEDTQNSRSNLLPEIFKRPLAAAEGDLTRRTRVASRAYDVIRLQRLAAEGGTIAKYPYTNRRMSRLNVINCGMIPTE